MKEASKPKARVPRTVTTVRRLRRLRMAHMAAVRAYRACTARTLQSIHEMYMQSEVGRTIHNKWCNRNVTLHARRLWYAWSVNPTDREVLSKADECNNCTTARQYRNPYRLRYVYHYATMNIHQTSELLRFVLSSCPCYCFVSCYGSLDTIMYTATSTCTPSA